MKNTRIVEEKPFESMSEIITDIYFIGFVETQISEIKEYRRNRPKPKQGFKYTRDWFDQMGKDVNVDYFIANIESIWKKESKLSSEHRWIIKRICDIALRKMIQVYYPEEVK